jgi:hypothetical protein
MTGFSIDVCEARDTTLVSKGLLDYSTGNLGVSWTAVARHGRQLRETFPSNTKISPEYGVAHVALTEEHSGRYEAVQEDRHAGRKETEIGFFTSTGVTGQSDVILAEKPLMYT